MRNSQLRIVFISAEVLIVGLIGFGMLRYPHILSEAGVMSILVPVFMLVLYGVVAVWSTHQPGQVHTAALESGTAFGLLVGITFIISISVENFATMSVQISTISTIGLMLLIFMLFALAGWRAAKDSGQLRVGIFASIWSAMTGVLLALIFGFAINFLFTQRLEQNLQTSAEYFRSSSRDLVTFTFWNTLDSASSHLFEAPIIAAILGISGSLISLGFSQLRKKFTDSQGLR